MAEAWTLSEEKNLEDGELSKLFNAAKADGPRTRLMIILSYHGALRVSELVHLKVACFHFDDCIVSVTPVKKIHRPKPVDVIFPRAVMELVRRHVDVESLGRWLFPGNVKKCWLKNYCAGGHVSKREVQKTFDRLCRATGIKLPGRGIHSLKHTRLVDVASKTKDPQRVKEAGRHASVTIADGYFRFVEGRA